MRSAATSRPTIVLLLVVMLVLGVQAWRFIRSDVVDPLYAYQNVALMVGALGVLTRVDAPAAVKLPLIGFTLLLALVPAAFIGRLQAAPTTAPRSPSLYDPAPAAAPPRPRVVLSIEAKGVPADLTGEIRRDVDAALPPGGEETVELQLALLSPSQLRLVWKMRNSTTEVWCGESYVSGARQALQTGAAQVIVESIRAFREQPDRC